MGALKKPKGREEDDNRTWVAFLINRFPQLGREELDPKVSREMAEQLAPDIGLTADEYVARCVVACASYSRDDFFIEVRFYDDTAYIELPNFPQTGIEQALREARGIIDALVSIGFEVLDPQRARSSHDQQAEESLVAAYEDRQGTVEHVARLVRDGER